MIAESRRASRVILLSFLSFASIGTAAGLLGLAWPSMRLQFGLQEDSIGLLLIAQTIGYMTSSFFSGRMLIGLGTARALLIGAVLLAVGLFGIAVAPLWQIVIAFGLVSGLGNGVIDAGLNNYVSSYYSTRQMNWLHASFGGGWVLGTFIMTTVLSRGLAWQVGYGIFGAVNLGLAVIYVVTARMWRNGLPQEGMKEGVKHAPLRKTIRLPMLWISVLLMLVYVGLEASPSTWLFSIFTSARGLDVGSAGLWVTIFLLSFTVGRVFFGFVGDRIPRQTMIRLCMAGAFAGALLLWWNPVDWVGFFGLLLLSFAQAPLFALIILGTADRVGPEHTANAIGMQISAAGAGFAVVPALGGIIAQNAGLAALLPFFALLAILMFVLNEVSARSAARIRSPERVAASGD